MHPEDMTLQELGQLGERYALRQLVDRGFHATATRPNAREIDIVVQDTHGNPLCDVQVKARCRYRNWTLNRMHETIIRPRLFYCLVRFGLTDADDVTCWIVPNKVVADCVRETHQAYLAESPETRRDTNRRHVREDYSNRARGLERSSPARSAAG